MGEAWTSVSPAAASPTLAVSNAADVSYVKTERMWPGETAHRRGERPNIEYTHAWARASKPSADSAPGSESGGSSPPAECARSSTPCASTILSSSCGTTQK